MANAPVPTRNGKPWKHCGKCGKKMLWTQRGRGYDRTTGQETAIFTYRCAEWTPHHSAAHDAMNRVLTEDEKDAGLTVDQA